MLGIWLGQALSFEEAYARYAEGDLVALRRGWPVEPPNSQRWQLLSIATDLHFGAPLASDDLIGRLLARPTPADPFLRGWSDALLIEALRWRPDLFTSETKHQLEALVSADHHDAATQAILRMQLADLALDHLDDRWAESLLASLIDETWPDPIEFWRQVYSSYGLAGSALSGETFCLRRILTPRMAVSGCLAVADRAARRGQTESALQALEQALNHNMTFESIWHDVEIESARVALLAKRSDNPHAMDAGRPLLEELARIPHPRARVDAMNGLMAAALRFSREGFLALSDEWLPTFSAWAEASPLSRRDDVQALHFQAIAEYLANPADPAAAIATLERARDTASGEDNLDSHRDAITETIEVIVTGQFETRMQTLWD